MPDTENEGEDLIKAMQAQTDAAELKAIAEETEAFEKEIKEKMRANGKILGITFGPNASIATMRAQLAEAREQIFSEDAIPLPENAPKSEHDERRAMILEMTKLVRVRIACLNPAKSGLPGEIMAIHNDIVGTIKKFIPYDEAGDEYHIPYILFKMLKRKQFLQIKDPPKPRNGAPSGAPSTKLVPEFSIEILPQLTPKELDDLKRAQGAAAASE
jgi:hypothetical protein